GADAAGPRWDLAGDADGRPRYRDLGPREIPTHRLREVLLAGEQGPGKPQRSPSNVARRPGHETDPRVHRELRQPEELRPNRPRDHERQARHRGEVGPLRGG